MKLFLTAGVLALLSPLSLAGELRTDRVPADARWVVHFDADAVRQTSLWNLVQSGLVGNLKEELEEGMEEIRSEFGIDPMWDLHSFTVYGLSENEEEAIVMAETTSSVDNALARLRQESSYRSISSGDLIVHSWDDDNETFYAYIHAEGDRRVVLFSNQSDQITDGIRMLHGKGPSLKTASKGITARPRPGSVFFVSASEDVPGMDWAREQSEIASMLGGVTLDVGEQGGRIFAHVSAVTDDIEQATQVRSVAEGLLALATLGVGMGDLELPIAARELIDAVRVEQRNREIIVRFEYDTRNLIQEIMSLEEHGRGNAR